MRVNFDRSPLVAPMLLCFVLCLFAGCTTMKTYEHYEGQQLPDHETVHLINKGSSLLLRGSNILVYSVDGVKSPDGEKTYSPGEFRLLPGNHTLTVSFYRPFLISRGCEYFYHSSRSTWKVDVTFETEPGHTYFLTSRQDPKKEKWYFIVTDKASDRRVFEAGPYPSETVKEWHTTHPVCICCE